MDPFEVSLYELIAERSWWKQESTSLVQDLDFDVVKLGESGAGAADVFWEGIMDNIRRALAVMNEEGKVR